MDVVISSIGLATAQGSAGSISRGAALLAPEQRLPVFSSSCNSGLHALYAARQVLLSGRANEAVVLAVDILSRSNQENFEGLRVLSDSPMPWQPTNAGFVLGEAAVALRLVRDADGVAGGR